MNILITGCNGMLGREFYPVLKEKGYKIYGIDNLLDKKNKYRFDEFYYGDVADKEQMRKQIVEICKPHIILHCAAWTDVDACEKDKDKAKRINSEGTKIIASFAKEINALICYISTDFIFDGKKQSPYIESDKPHPINVYGETKLKGEEAIKRSGASYIIVRTSWLFGGDKQSNNFVNAIINQYDSGETLRVVDDQKGRPTYTRDFAQAVIKVIEFYKDKKDVHEIVHIANEGEISWFKFAQLIVEKIGGDTSQVIAIPSTKLNRAAKRPKNSVLNTEKYEGDFEDKLRSWQFGLDEYINKLKIEKKIEKEYLHYHE